MPDHAYLVRGCGAPTFKVGWTRSPEKRMKAHADSLGPCETHVFPVADGRAAEMAVLAHLRLSGALHRHSSGAFSEVAFVGDEMRHLMDSVRIMAGLTSDEPAEDARAPADPASEPGHAEVASLPPGLAGDPWRTSSGAPPSAAMTPPATGPDQRRRRRAAAARARLLKMQTDLLCARRDGRARGLLR